MTTAIVIKKPVYCRLFWSQTQQEFFTITEDDDFPTMGRFLLRIPESVANDFFMYVEDRRAAEEPISYQEMLFHLKDFISNH